MGLPEVAEDALWESLGRQTQQGGGQAPTAAGPKRGSIGKAAAAIGMATHSPAVTTSAVAIVVGHTNYDVV